MKCSHCNVKAAQWKIRDHESNICMEKVIPCTNSPFGCDLMLKRQVLFNKLIRNEHVLFVRLGKISSIIFTAVQLLFHIALWFSWNFSPFVQRNSIWSKDKISWFRLNFWANYYIIVGQGVRLILEFSMEYTLIFSSVTPPKNQISFGRREGVKQDAKMSLFFMSLLWGGRGSRQINQISLNFLFIFWRLP